MVKRIAASIQNVDYWVYRALLAAGPITLGVIGWLGNSWIAELKESNTANLRAVVSEFSRFSERLDGFDARARDMIGRFEQEVRSGNERALAIRGLEQWQEDITPRLSAIEDTVDRVEAKIDKAIGLEKTP